MTLLAGRRAAVASCLATLAAVGWYVAVAGGRYTDAAYIGISSASSVVAWLGARRQRWSAVPTLVALGLTLSTVADITFRVLTWSRGAMPDISVADVPWLASYAAIATALLQAMRRGRGREGADVDGRIDTAVAFVAALLLQWQFGLHQLIDDGTTEPFVRLVWALYPAADAVLIALAARALIGRHLHGRMAAALGGGAVCWLCSDVTFAALPMNDGLVRWLDAGWLLGGLVLAASTWAPVDAATPPARTAPTTESQPALLLALLPLLLPGAIEVLEWARGIDPDPLPLFGAMVVLAGLTFLRAARLQRAALVARAQLESRERYAAAVAANSADALALLDADGRIVNDAATLAALLGRPGEDLRGEGAVELIDPEDAAVAAGAFERALQRPGEVFTAELRARRAGDRPLHLKARMVNLLDDPDVAGVVVNLHDITARRLAEQDLAHQAFHDGLTGLANRALFADRLGHAIQRSARRQDGLAVLFLDLDGFKTVNDGLGHGTGDALLCEVARRLAAAVRSTETVARLGGDEFAVLVEQSDRAQADAEAIAERILAALAVPIPLEDQDLVVSASIGIALGDAASTTISMLRDADVAMYQAKASGKGRAVVYDTAMRSAVLERLQLETELASALAGDQFRLVYQPVVELETERVVGFEALLRWDHPTLGPIPPDRFIPLAEDSGLIVPIGAWALREACTTAAGWHRDHPDHDGVTIAVNLSGRQIASDDLLGHVAAALGETGLDPSTLVLEMTETVLVQDPVAAATRLQQLHDLGIRLAIDDFGTGYSSLSYLRQFPVDILKIDRSFIDAITDRQQVPAIVRGLLDLGRTLQLETLAEGVELEVQRDQLRDEHCSLAQGYLFARPLTAEDAELVLAGLAPGRAVA